ncbi:hypothetical protein N658DRAFT_100976 [Parathielavia hyrcaniae]|uniref:Uncharacterized protein n=1 Tax=Parathielavia hyrcaniae TaxID=113614 RepID=A0AAN6T094_9PEZI|nr:hypothetical protein N658DRAFT_100976 [Parathielavia hyrcaniae]
MLARDDTLEHHPRGCAGLRVGARTLRQVLQVAVCPKASWCEGQQRGAPTLCGGHDMMLDAGSEIWPVRALWGADGVSVNYGPGAKHFFPASVGRNLLRLLLARCTTKVLAAENEPAAVLASHLCNPNPSQQADMLVTTIRMWIPARDGALVPWSPALLLSTIG